MNIKYIIFFCLIPCIGCTPYYVNVNSISSGVSYSGAKCILLPMDPNITSSNNLQFQEYASYIKTALRINEYELTENINEAKIIVFLSYGISKPHERIYSYSTPVWGQTGISSAYTTGSIHSYGGGSASFSGTTTYTPQYGITGYQSHIGTSITYNRFIFLGAYDLEEYIRTKKEVQVWETTAVSTGDSGDLRQVFPVMVAALSKYIGKNTGKQIEVSLFENDVRVKEIKGISVKQESSEKAGTITKQKEQEQKDPVQKTPEDELKEAMKKLYEIK